MFKSRSVVSRALTLSLNRSARAALPSSFVAVCHLSTSRRRRGQTGAPTGDTSTPEGRAAVNRPVRVTDTLEFVMAAQDFLDKIEEALEPMKKHNDIFIVTRDSNRLTLMLGIGEGEYSLEIYEDGSSILMQTPISGKFSYVLSSKTQDWVNEEDGHMLVGMFVRDLIRQCNGVPDL